MTFVSQSLLNGAATSSDGGLDAVIIYCKNEGVLKRRAAGGERRPRLLSYCAESSPRFPSVLDDIVVCVTGQ